MDENKGLIRKREVLGELDRRVRAQGGVGFLRSGTRTPVTGEVYLIIDCSGSMYGKKIEQAKVGALQFAEEARSQGYRIGVISFASDANLVNEATADKTPLVQAVGRLETGGSTNMTAGLLIARSKFQKKSVGAQAVVVVTDGFPDDQDSALKEAEKLRQKGVRIITIGTDDADRTFLARLSSHQRLANYVRPDRLSLAMKSASRMLPGTAGSTAERTRKGIGRA